MNIHHYYSILSLLKFERTTEREKKGKKKKRKKKKKKERIGRRFEFFRSFPWKNTRNLNVTQRDACTKVVHAAK